MQEALVQRYLGNKNSISKEIVNLIGEVANRGDLVFDAFSGSLAASAAIRAAGYEVSCNDINHFSWLYANAYFSTSELPTAKVGNEVFDWNTLIHSLTIPYESSFPNKFKNTFIHDHYCEAGDKSEFVSSRGTEGRRRFFSSENAQLIDVALNKIRYWYQTNKITDLVRCILSASLISAVEKVSNTQGTFHDFPRTLTDARSLNRIALKTPKSEMFGGIESRFIGKAQDTIDYVKTLPKHKVMYLDPPYNFRQYTSYYFMLNLLSQYSEIQDLSRYFSEIKFVRGQNMSSDFKSTFCSKKHFLSSLKELIENAKCEYVVLSYFDGRNHWGEFKSEKADVLGESELTKLFKGDLFVDGTFKCIPVKRTNYQSYGGYEAKAVNEFLFLAKKKNQTLLNQSGSERIEEELWIGSAVA